LIKELLYKWFGLEPFPCNSCEVLRSQLDESNRERRELLKRILEPPEPITTRPAEADELTPITPKYVPWHVRQQLLEAEDRKAAQLKRDKDKEIKDLEKELGVTDATSSK
jgi:hypothetical protein